MEQSQPCEATAPPRWYQSMVYVPSTHRVIMFGGFADSGNNALNDTWAYDPVANTWTNLSPSGLLPPVRGGQSMVYDSVAHRVIMFGGHGDSGFLSDTWAYDPSANKWSELGPTGPVPPVRAYQSMAYDSSSGRVIMFGGEGVSGDLNDTWAYDAKANAWTNLSPTGTLPYPRVATSMVYSPSSDRVIMFGGLFQGGKGTLGDTWSYDPEGNAWAILAPSGTLPSARGSQSMVYDPVNGRAITFGGSSDSGFLNDTYVYTP
jgi:N-acetylneuraminic acid mutarotase